MDVIIVGAGLAGLVAATTLARAGRSVTVFERAAAPGGRAVTTFVGPGADYALSLGPHALYTGGAAARILAGLGVRAEGRDPGNVGHVLHRDALHALPGSPWTFLTTGLFDFAGRVQALGFVRRLLFDDAAAHDRVSVTDWLAPVTDPTVQAWARAMIRVFTYANDPDRQSAGAVIRQARLAVRFGVRYLDGGWGTLSDGLTAAATAAGVTLRTAAEVDAIDTAGERPRVQVDGAWVDARAVLIATPLPAARRLLPELPAAPPIRAACLDLALARSEKPAARFVLGIDRPLYLSVQSATAKLAPSGGMVVHVAHYLAPDEQADVAELEALADRALPGWRAQVVARRFLPALTVASGFSLASGPRPGIVARPGVWVAGDWVGPEGELADTSAASAVAAATAILAAADAGMRAGA
ncbi:MAG: FAD-dependent oxidoreductase [Pseudomonadota bacterium]|nr:FAD-dependent oxidoreductase [Pseudomonadota bacterium]